VMDERLAEALRKAKETFLCADDDALIDMASGLTVGDFRALVSGLDQYVMSVAFLQSVIGEASSWDGAAVRMHDAIPSGSLDPQETPFFSSGGGA